jgi:hypothetical protein
MALKERIAFIREQLAALDCYTEAELETGKTKLGLTLGLEELENTIKNTLIILQHTNQKVTGPVLGKAVVHVRVDDIIRLRPKNTHAQEKLNYRGQWWKIVSGSGIPLSSQVSTARPPSWYIRSLPRSKQGLPAIAGAGEDIMYIQKEDDPNYEIIQVCPCPTPFRWQDYK